MGRSLTAVVASAVVVAGCYESHPLGAADAGPPPPPEPRTCPSREPVWARTFPTNGGASLAVGPDGHVYLIGSLNGRVDFGGTSLTSRGHYDVLLASLTADGEVRWARTFGGDSGDCFEGASGLDIDTRGNLYVSGAFHDTVEVAGATYTSEGSCDAFVGSWSPDGEAQWFRPIPGGANADWAGDVAVDERAGLVLASAVVGDEGESVPRLIGLGGAADLTFVAYDLAGAVAWRLRRGEAGGGAARGVAADDEGHFYLSGVLRGAEDLGGGPLGPVDEAGDAFVAGTTAAGVHRWSLRLAGSGLAEAVDVTARPGGPVVAGGVFEGTLQVQGQRLQADGCDGFLAAFGPGGEPRWARRFGGPGLDRSHGLDMTASGEVAVAAVAGSRTDARSALVMALSPSGACRWQWRPGGGSAFDVAYGADGSVYAAGTFNEPTDFGDGVVVPAAPRINDTPPRDLFIVKLPP